jgi:hypothetical protein
MWNKNKPSLRTCPNCGREYGTFSLAYHMKSCILQSGSSWSGDSRDVSNSYGETDSLPGSFGSISPIRSSPPRPNRAHFKLSQNFSRRTNSLRPCLQKDDLEESSSPPQLPPAFNRRQSTTMTDVVTLTHSIDHNTLLEMVAGSVTVTQPADLVPCPHCHRRFARDVSTRHIPKCQRTYHRPLPPQSGNPRLLPRPRSARSSVSEPPPDLAPPESESRVDASSRAPDDVFLEHSTRLVPAPPAVDSIVECIKSTPGFGPPRVAVHTDGANRVSGLRSSEGSCHLPFIPLLFPY